MKTSDHKIMKPHANLLVSWPDGKWRDAVRGFFASISASRTRLNAIATDRAATMDTTIQPSLNISPWRSKSDARHASKAPVSAKGSAKTECSNLIMSSVRRKRW